MKNTNELSENEIMFHDAIQGELMLKKWGDSFWIFKKHPDGQWVSLRIATEDDLQKLNDAGMIMYI